MPYLSCTSHLAVSYGMPLERRFSFGLSLGTSTQILIYWVQHSSSIVIEGLVSQLLSAKSTFRKSLSTELKIFTGRVEVNSKHNAGK